MDYNTRYARERQKEIKAKEALKAYIEEDKIIECEGWKVEHVRDWDQFDIKFADFKRE